MSADKMASAPDLTFVSMTGPTLDRVSAKAMRAYTTRANFARRRRRLVQDYARQKECSTPAKALQTEEDGLTANGDLVVDSRLPILTSPGLDRRLNRKDAFFINHLTQAMEKLHLITDIPESDTAFSVLQSDWARFLSDPTMLDVSLYFARHVYAARRQHHAVRIVVDTYKGKAIKSVRERLDYGSDNLSDSLIAAILILTVLDQVLGNIEAWKIHISGLLQIIRIRSQNTYDICADWIPNAVPRTIMQGLLLLARHDATVLNTIEKTGIFDTMFSAPAKKAAYIIIETAEEVAESQSTYAAKQQFDAAAQSRLSRIIESLDTATQLDRAAYPREAFLTALALSIKIFLQVVLYYTTDTEDDPGKTARKLMECFQRPDQQLPSSLALCSSLESIFWQTMMGAIAAPDGRTKGFFTSRLDKITVALALTSSHDAHVILQRFFWIPSIFSSLGARVLSEVLHLQGHTDI